MSKIIALFKKYYHILFFLFLSSWILLYQKEGILILEITSNQSWESMVNPILSMISKKERKVLHFWEKNMISFNPSKVKEYLFKQGMIVIDEQPLHKIPPHLYSILNNLYINYLLNILDKILLKITPKYLFQKVLFLNAGSYDKR